MRMRAITTVLLTAGLLVGLVGSATAKNGRTRTERFEAYVWDEVNPGTPWAPRAGLEAVAVGKTFYVLGGRTPNPWVPPPNGPLPGDSTIHGDVWRSTDRGETWTQILATDDADHWPARAYHEVVQRGRRPHSDAIQPVAGRWRRGARSFDDCVVWPPAGLALFALTFSQVEIRKPRHDCTSARPPQVC